MCRPTTTPGPSPTTATHNVVICGAGPAGLLAAILLLRRNTTSAASASNAPRYRVTLVDPGTDYGKLDADGLNRARSWMIGLSSHGLSAIRDVPGLYDNYIHGLGIDITKAVFGLSKSLKFELNAKDILPDDSAFTVDRNFICAALSRYLIDQYGNDDMFVSHYHSRALYVDGDNKSVVVRQTMEGDSSGTNDGPATNDMTIAYDILLGCDGIRSIVRNAFLTRHRDFEFDLRGTFGYGKSVHVALPEGMDPGTFMFFNEALPNFGSFILPETGNKLNVALGTAMNKECAPELKSEDAAVVAEYFREHWHAFEIDADEAGRQWVAQGWNTISQVHCNFYHSESLSALLLGDAAHATSPQIGQGMNTALADAAALNRLLDENKDDWTVVLPKFSEGRVKEGQALTDLSFYTFSLSARQQLSLMLRQNIRRTMHGIVPWLVDPDPMSEVSKGMRLSEAYHRMSKLGVIPRVRKVNDGIMRDHFEKETGMVRTDDSASIVKNICLYGLPVAAAAAAMAGAFLGGGRGR
mmetsp:Transcript_12279/g.35144  ORF Transcript_12279/g.35144 Transcript_12279/m.35144 type:complete len:525 (-) Transcript_12279:77-1651(-)|eukprot:CAMPEP_0181039036 /NCGR_PEP_ID=MMETSP1070-20121207/10248_1 /TAXON_ID=265543 /ORGANISM="Minutocellus polymorphus, Strain NH13" /LENGTH=524 /DNA_ID=CAMNT_0023116847 /DNA_START=184 /DNA_END=1758 /DNA_ORIENTATION=+